MIDKGNHHHFGGGLPPAREACQWVPACRQAGNKPVCLILKWWGGRVVEGGSLENCYTRNRIVSSNLTPTADRSGGRHRTYKLLLKNMTKAKTLLFSSIAGVLYVGYELLKPQYSGEGFGEIAIGLQYIFIGIILIPTIFGILGFVFSKEKRLTRALSSFGISLTVMLVLMLAVGAWKNMERQRLYPSTVVPVLAPDSPTRKMPLPQ